MNRTQQQNKSIHKYCELMADGLNNTQHSVQEVCKLPISWTKENFKENIWKPVQHAMYPEITSTTQLNTKQVNDVYEEVNKLMSDWGVSRDMPSIESMYAESQGRFNKQG